MLRRLFAIVGCLVLVTTFVCAQGPKTGDAKDKDKDKADKDGPAKLATQGATPAVGEITLDYTFKNFMTGDGRTSLKELRGNVVLLDWWGIH